MLQLTAACRQYIDDPCNRSFKLSREEVERAFADNNYPCYDCFVDAVEELAGLYIASFPPWLFFPDAQHEGIPSGTTVWQLEKFFENHGGEWHYNVAEDCDTLSLVWLNSRGQILYEPDEEQILSPSLKAWVESSVYEARFFDSCNTVFYSGEYFEGVRCNELAPQLDARFRRYTPGSSGNERVMYVDSGCIVALGTNYYDTSLPDGEGFGCCVTVYTGDLHTYRTLRKKLAGVARIGKIPLVLERRSVKRK